MRCSQSEYKEFDLVAEICLPKGSTFCRSCPEVSAALIPSSDKHLQGAYRVQVTRLKKKKKDVGPYVHSLAGNVNFH